MHQTTPIGVVVAQLGTPDAPTAKALRPYLRQFLGDLRVVDYNPLLWQPLLRGIILRTRPRRSARLYQRIWTDEGSPLLVYTRRQAAGLQARLGSGFRVVAGMTYGSPSIRDAVRGLEAAGIDRILIFPMYPQYSYSTTASVYDAAYTAAAGRRCPLFHERKRRIPTLRFVPPYYDHPGYIAALAQRVRDTMLDGVGVPLGDSGQAGMALNGANGANGAGASMPETAQTLPVLVFSFHGVPQRYVDGGDPYYDQCQATVQRLAAALELDEQHYRVTFQSKFGPEQWLQPATDETLKALGAAGSPVIVFSPGFTADCLETLDELGNEGSHQYAEAGGQAQHFRLAACLNDHPAWLDTMADIVRQECGGWLPAQVAAAAAQTLAQPAQGGK